MNLVSIYRVKGADKILYDLLKSREKEVNISHRKMPTFDEHKAFIKSYPYKTWEMIKVGRQYVGSIYLSRNSEIGIHIFPQYKRKSYKLEAVRRFISKHESARFLANVNPKNKSSVRTFKRLGFKLIQHTYERAT